MEIDDKIQENHTRGEGLQSEWVFKVKPLKVLPGRIKMKLTEVKGIAKGMGLKTGNLKKAELIRSIQSAESNIPCFGTERVQYCGEEGCLWRDDCLNTEKA